MRRAAESRGESATDYVVRHAVLAAESDLADRRVFIVDDETFDALQTMLSAPLVVPDKIAQLLATPSVLESTDR